MPGGGTAALLPVPFWGAVVPGLATVVAVAAAAAAATVAGAATPGVGGGPACWAAGVAGAVGRGAGRRGRRHAALGIGRDARLELGGALGRAARPFAQALDLTRLREVEQRQDAEPEDRGDARVGSVLLDLAL